MWAITREYLVQGSDDADDVDWLCRLENRRTSRFVSHCKVISEGLVPSWEGSCGISWFLRAWKVNRSAASWGSYVVSRRWGMHANNGRPGGVDQTVRSTGRGRSSSETRTRGRKGRRWGRKEESLLLLVLCLLFLSSSGFSRRVLLQRRVTASRNGNHRRERVGRRE